MRNPRTIVEKYIQVIKIMYNTKLQHNKNLELEFSQAMKT